MRPYPPLGLLYLSAWLDKFGVPHEVCDTTFSTKGNFYAILTEKKPKLLGLYVNLMTKLNVLEAIRWARQHPDPDIRSMTIALGGPDVTHNLKDYLANGADLLVIGEGEQTMLELALAVQTGAPWAGIPGTACLDAHGNLVKGPPREKMRDLDELPFPNRSKIDLNLYLEAWKGAHGQSALSISTQRGCPYTCRWCSTAVYGQSYRRRSPAHVVDEIQALQRDYDFDLIWFVDDVFTVSHRWLEGFRDELRARGISIAFECITRADRLNGEALATLKEAGCFRVWIGAESGSQRILDAMDRRVQAAQVRDMIQKARALGIETGTFIMLGYPGETEADIRTTVSHLIEADPHLFTITLAYPIKGTGLYEEVQDTAFSELPWEKRSDRDVDFERTYPRLYYDFALRWTVNAVRFHQARKRGKGLGAWRLWAKSAFARAGMCLARSRAVSEALRFVVDVAHRERKA